MASGNNTLRPSSSTSWLGSLATGGPDLRFSTFGVSGGGAHKASPRRKLGAALFEEEGADRPGGARQNRIEDELRELRGLETGSEQGWSITVAEGPKARSRSRKPDPTLTIYVSTPTASLTLTRKTSELVDLDARLRAVFPHRFPSPDSARIVRTPKKRNTVLASLTRTLSPRRSEKPSFPWPATSAQDSLQTLGATLTMASRDGQVRSHNAWVKFFVARRDDLESARVERRIKRVRSDETMHIASGLAAASEPRGLGQPIVRQDRQDLSVTETEVSLAASGATQELVVGTLEEANTSILAVLGDGQVYRGDDDKLPSADEVTLDAGLDRREESIGTAAMEVSVELILPVATVPVTVVDAVGAEDDVDRPNSEEPSESAQGQLSGKPALGDVEAYVDPAPYPSSFLDPSSASSRSMARTSSCMSTATTITRRSRAITLDSFQVLRVLGKGCAGKVLLVQKKDTGHYFALKAITKRHVLAHRELAHTRTEQAILKKCAKDQTNPFVVKLHYSFHDHDTLYLALDFHPGGDLATQLARWGRLGRDRTRFYISEIIDGVASLHRAGIIYRDLKPENILISADGHIVLTDFGLSKFFEPGESVSGLPQPHRPGHPARSASTPPAVLAYLYESALATPESSPYFTSTFCGTSEYLAPEVLLGEPYTFSVDWFSAGTLLYEMLAGITPFYAEDHPTMYRRVLQDELEFDDSLHCFDDDTKSLLRGMLQRNPHLRITHTRMVRHPYFAMIDWSFIRLKRYQPPFVPKLNPDDPTDTSQFEHMFLSLPPQVKGDDPEHEPGGERDPPQGEPQAALDETGRDVFDGYSYFGRDSASIHRQDVLDEGSDDEAGAILVVVEESKRYSTDEQGALEGERPVETAVKVPTRTASPPQASLSESSLSAGGVGHVGRDTEGSPADWLPDSRDDLTSSTPPPPPGEALPPLSDALINPCEVFTDHAVSGPTDELVLSRTHQQSVRRTLEPLLEGLSTNSPSVVTGNPTVETETPDEDLLDHEWDLVERADVGGFVRNGGREATLWQRGFRDRYRLVLAPLTYPARPLAAMRRSSSQGPVVGTAPSSSSARSSLHISPVTTPEPPSPRPGALRRLTSIRSSTSARAGGTGLRAKGSLDASLYASTTGLAPMSSSAPSTPRLGATNKGSQQSLAPSARSSPPTGPIAVDGVESNPPSTSPRRSPGQAFKSFIKPAFLATTPSRQA